MVLNRCSSSLLLHYNLTKLALKVGIVLVWERSSGGLCEKEKEGDVHIAHISQQVLDRFELPSIDTHSLELLVVLLHQAGIDGNLGWCQGRGGDEF
jgi:hypothetical protein